VSARTIARRWAGRIAGRRVRDAVRLPHDVALLQARQAELEARLTRVEAELLDARIRAGRADDALARLTDGLAVTSATAAALERDLVESRRLSHRVAQLTDVVFDRLAERPGDQPT
jgi:hypothetical protein